MKKLWDWEDHDCLQAFWELFKSERTLNRIPPELERSFVEVPAMSIIYSWLEKGKIQKMLLQVATIEEVQEALSLHGHNGYMADTGRRSLWVPPPSKFKLDAEDERLGKFIAQATGPG